jgi:hypothetical protein
MGSDHDRMVIVVDDNVIWRRGLVGIINELDGWRADGLDHSAALVRSDWDSVFAVLIDLHDPLLALDKYPGFGVCKHVRRRREISNANRPMRLYAVTSFADANTIRELTAFYGFDFRYSKADLISSAHVEQMLSDPATEHVVVRSVESSHETGTFRDKYLKLTDEAREKFHDHLPSKQGNLRRQAQRRFNLELGVVRSLKRLVLGETTKADEPRFPSTQATTHSDSAE